VAKKSLTADQVAAKQAKAVQFLRDVVGDADKADQFEAMDPQEYADHKGITIANQGETKMPNGNSDPRTKSELLDEIEQLERDNEDLESQLSAIADIVAPSDEGDDDDDGADYDDDGDDDRD